MARFDAKEKDTEFKERIVAINRVSKTVKGGRIFKFAALVVVGDGNGTVGFGLGKAGEVPDAIRKGIEDAKKNLIKISLKGSTIPHEVVGAFGAGRVLLPPVPALSPVALCVPWWKRPALRISGPRLFAPTTPATWSAPPWKGWPVCARRNKRRLPAAKPPRKS